MLPAGEMKRRWTPQNQRCRSLLSIGGDNLPFYPNFALFSTLGGLNLDHDFFPVSILSEDQKKVFTKIGSFFFPNSSEDQQRSDADQSQIIGGIQQNYLGNISASLMKDMIFDCNIQLGHNESIYTLFDLIVEDVYQ